MESQTKEREQPWSEREGESLLSPFQLISPLAVCRVPLWRGTNENMGNTGGRGIDPGKTSSG
jgi:hypothetical protein